MTRAKLGRFIFVSTLIAALAIPTAWTLGQAPATEQAPTTTTVPSAKKPVPPADPVALLKVIPADVAGFVAVRNLSELDYDVNTLGKQLGIPIGPNGLWPGLLAWFRDTAMIEQGLDENASLAVVLLNVAQLESASDITQQVVIYIPTTDANALADSLGGTKDEDGLWHVNLMGQPTVGVSKGGYMILAETAEPVKAAVKAAGEGVIKSMTADRLKDYQASDIFAWANMQSLSPKVRDGIIETVQMALSMTGQDSQANAENMKQLAIVLDSLAEASIGLSLDSRKGLSILSYTRAKPDTDMARDIAAMKAVDGTLLTGLPNDPALFAMGFTGSELSASRQKQLEDTINEAFATASKAAALSGETLFTDEQIKAVRDPIIKLLGSVEQFAFALYSLPPQNENGLISLVKVGKIKDAQQGKALSRQLFEAIKAMIMDVVQKHGEWSKEDIDTAAACVQWKENAENLDGLMVDHFSVDLQKMPGTTEDGRAQLNGVLGPEGILVRVAAVDNKFLVVTFGGGKERFRQVVDLVKKGESPMTNSRELRLVADRLPQKQKIVEAYVNLDHIAGTIMAIAQQLGEPIPFPLAFPNTAPISIVVNKAGENAQQGELLLPTELFISVGRMVQPMIGMFMMSQGGGMGPMDMDGDIDENDGE